MGKRGRMKSRERDSEEPREGRREAARQLEGEGANDGWREVGGREGRGERDKRT